MLFGQKPEKLAKKKFKTKFKANGILDVNVEQKGITVYSYSKFLGASVEKL